MLVIVGKRMIPTAGQYQVVERIGISSRLLFLD
jgi:hypothetical protein